MSDFHHWTITLSNWQKQPPEAFHKKAVLKNFAIFSGSPVLKSHLGRGCNKVAGRKGLQLYWKEAPTQMFSCEYCKISNNTYFEEHINIVSHFWLNCIIGRLCHLSKNELFLWKYLGVLKLSFFYIKTKKLLYFCVD